MPRLSAPLAALDDALEASLQVDGPAMDTRLAFQVGEHRFLVDARALTEVGQVPPISRLGQMPPAVVGLANFRGVPRTLMDGPALLGLGTLTDPANSWATVLHSDDLDVAVLWPTVLGLFPASQYTPTSATPVSPLTPRAWLDAQGQVWQDLDIPVLLAQLRRAPAKEPA